MTKPTKCLIKCPACRLKRTVGREKNRRIKKGLQTATCSFCNVDGGNKRIKKVKKLTCPNCKKTRMVTDAIYKRFTDGKSDGQCRSCSSSANNKTRRKGSFNMVVVKVHGCVLIENPDGGRCDKFFECRYNDECAGAIAKKCIKWEGFSADCAGFKEIQVEYELPNAEQRASCV